MTFEPSISTFRSRSEIIFDAHPGDQTFVDVRPQILHSATLNGRSVDVDSAFVAAESRLSLTELCARNQLIVDATMAYSNDGEGMVRHVDPADDRVYLYAMSFLDAAPRWFACFDQPDLKGPFRLTVHCPPDWTVAGNGPAVQHAPGSWTIEQSRPIATYLATVVAGPYHVVAGEHDGITLTLRSRQSLATALDRDAPALLAHTSSCLDEFHRLFGTRYPWGEYHQAFVADFNAGAMENPGCITYRDQLLFRSRVTGAELVDRDTTIAHEMAHMWFGDLVTMRWWDDLWLNESFAEYLGHRVCTALGASSSWVSFGIARKAWGYAADRRPSTHPVAGNGAADATAALADFDGISYAKGAATLRQLATRLGDNVFLGGLRAYIAEHAYGNAEFTDLLAAWTAAGADDIVGWAEQWLRRPSVDTLAMDGSLLVRTAPVEHPADRQHAVAVVAYDERREHVDVLVAGEVTATGLSAVVERAALVLPDAADQTWAKISLPPATWASMPSLLPELEPVARVVVWNSLRLAVADADVAAQSAVELVAAALPVETEDVVLATVLAWATALIGTYLDSDAGSAASAALAAATDAALAASGEGSGRQLAAARGVIATSSDAARLQSWLAGAVPSGVLLDPDLRWQIVARLCALGAFGDAEIAAELASDNSSEGASNAARCRALLPDAHAKNDAWQLLMTNDGSTNSVLYATAQGFWHSAQTTITQPFVARYFDEIAATATFRSGWVVSRLAALAYPRTAVSADTLERTDAFLTRQDLPGGVRRAVVDAGDDLRRAVRSRERFGDPTLSERRRL